MSEALNPELVLVVEVASSSLIARDIRCLELVDPRGEDLPPFTPGAHLLVQAPNGMTRRYSLCNPPSERNHYLIAVKREPSGRGGSASMVDDVRCGDTMYVSLPRNDFELVDTASSHLLIAGGVGITPIRSMAYHLYERGRPFRLCYLTREAEATAFGQELAQSHFRDRVVIHHDHGDPDQAFDLWPLLEKPKGGMHLWCCGPRTLMDAVRDMTGHWSSSAVHFEDFSARNVAHSAADKPFRVKLVPEGEAIDVPADVSILEALRRHGYRVPSSCESGTCGTCRVKLIAGEPDHRDLVLTEEQRRREITVCVSRAHSAELVLQLS